MDDKHTPGLPARRTEKRLVKMASAVLRADCPNPERIGCPSSSAVEAVVARRLASPDFDNVVDHIATCAPCFEEYNRQRQRYRLRNAGAVVLGCAALLVLAFFWKYGPAKQPHPRELVAKDASAPALAATLDYRNWTADALGAVAITACRDSAFGPSAAQPHHKTANRHRRRGLHGPIPIQQ